MDEADILSILTSELSNATFSDSDQVGLQTPLQYYLGLPLGTEIEGRSQIRSTDVADAIEWIIPQIMKSFTANNEIVVFDPVHEGDEKQADLESEYVYDVLMKQNDGFICIHQFVKDALMQRNGVLKVYFEEYTETKTESFSGLSDVQLQMLAGQTDVDVIELSSEESIDQMGMVSVQHSVKVAISKKQPKICVESIPLEQFRINSDHNSVNPDKARFTAHVMTKTISELREMGYDENVLKKLATDDNLLSSYRFEMQGETSFTTYENGSNDESMRLVTVVEAYMRMDINKDGIAEYVKITAAGDDANPTYVLDVEEVDCCPWIATTAIMMSHKFQGLSIFDRLKQIEEHKTALWRSIMDNMYLQNNQRYAGVEGRFNLDDMLTSRPGGIIRVDSIDAIMPLQTPQIGPAAFDMMRYLDEVRGGRSGVSPEGSATHNNIGNKVGSEGVERLMIAKEELVGLIVRVMAETGIKPLCIKIRDLLTKHVDAVRDFQFRGQWVKVNPAEWKTRTQCTVRIGTGSGDHRAKVSAIREVLQLQQLIMQVPGQALIKPEKAYSTLDDFCKFAGLTGANRYFVDPSSEEGQQMQQQASASMQQQSAKEEQNNMAMAKMAEAEMIKSQAQIQNNQLKAQIDTMKAQHDIEIRRMRNEIDTQKAIAEGIKNDAELQFKYDQLNAKTAMDLTKLEQDEVQQLNSQFFDNDGMIQ